MKPRVMTEEHQRLFVNTLRDCLGLDPLYSEKDQKVAPVRYSMQRRAVAEKEGSHVEPK